MRKLRIVPLLSAGLTLAAGLLAPAGAQDIDMGALMGTGEQVYTENCAACHGNEGEGTGSAPALAGNSFVESRSNLITQILIGAPQYGMPPFAPVLDDQQIAAVATYVRNSWGNDAGPVLARSVEMRRQ